MNVCACLQNDGETWLLVTLVAALPITQFGIKDRVGSQHVEQRQLAGTVLGKNWLVRKRSRDVAQYSRALLGRELEQAHVDAGILLAQRLAMQELRPQLGAKLARHLLSHDIAQRVRIAAVHQIPQVFALVFVRNFVRAQLALDALDACAAKLLEETTTIRNIIAQNSFDVRMKRRMKLHTQKIEEIQKRSTKKKKKKKKKN
jgi:hypothetical protein